MSLNRFNQTDSIDINRQTEYISLLNTHSILITFRFLIELLLVRDEYIQCRCKLNRDDYVTMSLSSSMIELSLYTMKYDIRNV
jgi:hypothetical protein